MTDHTTPEPSHPHGLRSLLFPTAEVGELVSYLWSLAQQGKITVIAVSYLEEHKEETNGDLKTVRRWHSSWATSDDVELPKTVVRGAIGRLSDAFASETVHRSTGPVLED